MRRYLQGTLDYACGIYAVINALSLCHNLGLEQARHIYLYSMEAIAAHPPAWRAFLRNHTDHYWVVRYMLERWCCHKPLPCLVEQPFSQCLLPRPHRVGVEEVEEKPLFFMLDEDTTQEQYQNPVDAALNGVLWQHLHAWFCPTASRRAAIVRFHRFLPGVLLPVVSHWTTIAGMEGNTLLLHDASGEAHSIHRIAKEDTHSKGQNRPALVLSPASLVLLEGFV